jgi:hypothetical protein
MAVLAGTLGGSAAYLALQHSVIRESPERIEAFRTCAAQLGQLSVMTNQLPGDCEPFRDEFAPQGRTAKTLVHVRPDLTDTPNTYYFLPAQVSFIEQEHARTSATKIANESLVVDASLAGAWVGQGLYPIGLRRLRGGAHKRARGGKHRRGYNLN